MHESTRHGNLLELHAGNDLIAAGIAARILTDKANGHINGSLFGIGKALKSAGNEKPRNLVHSSLLDRSIVASASRNILSHG